MVTENVVINNMNELVLILSQFDSNIVNITNKIFPVQEKEFLSVLLNTLKNVYIFLLILTLLLSLSSPKGRLRKRYVEFMAYLFNYIHLNIKNRNGIKLYKDTLNGNRFPGRNAVRSTNLGYNTDLSFNFEDNLHLLQTGFQDIIADGFTNSFDTIHPPKWNFLLRYTKIKYLLTNIELTLIWLCSFIVRFCILLPVRLGVFFISILIFLLCTIFIVSLDEGKFKRLANDKLSTFCFNLLSGCLCIVTTFHNVKNRPQSGIVVANHTTPIDSLILATDRCYDMVGRKQNGVLGFFMKILSWCSAHLWFSPTMSKDRSHVLNRIKERICDQNLPPIVIYPEGVCVNNTKILQFKKGVFELNAEICPVAMKFDIQFGDAFWWQRYFCCHALSMMTSWAIVCDVWYLPSTKKMQHESSLEFCNRVKTSIANQAGLASLECDGFLFSGPPVRNEWKERKHQYANFLLKQDDYSLGKHTGYFGRR